MNKSYNDQKWLIILLISTNLIFLILSLVYLFIMTNSLTDINKNKSKNENIIENIILS
jgi:hypothetical protein